MRACLLLAVLAVAAASVQLRQTETSIRPGKDYVYSYVSQVLSGVSVDNFQYAGLKLRANVRLQTKDGRKVNGKFESVTILKLNEEVRHHHPTDLVPDSQWQQVSGPEKEAIVQQIVRTFSFKMVPGKLVDLECERDDPHWSVNVKRGFLSFLQIDLEDQTPVRQDPEELRIADKLDLVDPRRESDENRSYRVMEEDITGKCETVYTVNRDQRSRDQLKVQKVRNFDNCVYRPIWKTGAMENILFGSDHEIKEVQQWQLEADYRVQGDRQNFLIKSGKLVSRQHFNRLNEEKGKLITYTVQMMTLDQVEDSRSQLRTSSDVQKKDSLIMEVAEPIVAERQQSERQLSDSEIRAKINLIEELLEEATRQTSPYVRVNATIPLGSLMFTMKDIPMRDLESLIQKYCTQSQITQKGEILLDLIGSCNRPDTVPTVMKLLRNNIISDIRASFIISRISLQSEATPTLARDLLQVVKSAQELQSRSPLMWRSSTLALGTVAFKLQQKKDTFHGRKANLDPVVSRIAQELNSLLEQARSNPDEKITVLKAMGNAGLPECMDQIKRIIKNPQEPQLIREKAIYALRNVARYAKQAVQNIVLPIYVQDSQPLKMRIAAFLMTMETRPSLGVAKTITQHLKKESSLQCGSFVYSYLKSFSELQDPSLANQTATIKKALTYAKPVRPGFQYSKAKMFDYFSQRWQSGFTATFEYLNSRNSYLPDTYIHRQDYDFAGFSARGNEMGLEMEGLQTILKNAIGPKSMLKDFLQGRLSLKDILEPIQHPSADMLSHIRSMMDKISITERDLRNFAAMMYFKSNNFEYNFVKFDSNSLQNAFQYALEKMPQIIARLERGGQWKLTKTSPWFQGAMVVPTPCGMPLSLNISFTEVYDVDASCQVENMPSIRDLLSQLGSSRQQQSYRQQQSDSYRQQQSDSYRQQKSDKSWRSSKDSEVKANVYIRPTILSQQDIFVNVQLAYLKTGVTAHMKNYATFPIRAEIKYDLEQAKLKTKLHMPQQDEQVYRMVVTSKTSYIQKHMDASRRDYVEEKVCLFPGSSRLIVKRDTYRIPFLDLDYSMDYQMAVPTKPSPMMTTLFFRKNITVTIKPCSETPREVVIENLFLGPQRADRARELIKDVLDVESESEESRDSQENKHGDDDSWWWTPSIYRRSSGQESDRRQDSSIPFDTVQVDQSISRPSKFKLVTVAKTHQSRSGQKKIQIQYTHIQDEDLEKHQDNLQIITKLNGQQSDQQDKKIELKSYNDLQVLKKYLLDERQHQLSSSQKELLNKLELHYGQKDRTEKKFDAETKVGRGAPLHLSRVPSYRSYDQQSQHGQSPLEVELEIEYQQVPHPVYQAGKKVKSYIKALPYIYDFVTVESEDARNPQNKVKLVAEFRSNETEIELLVKTPQENNLIKNLPIPFLPKRDAVCSLSDVGCFNKWAHKDFEDWHNSGHQAVKSFIHYISGGRMPGKCHIMREEVHTYDKKVLRLPKTDCETVIAKDCSSSSNPSFMVTTSKKNKDEDKKTVHIYLPEHKIKIEPDSGWFESGIEVEVNDRKIRVPEHGQSITIRRDDSDSISEKIAELKKQDGKIEVYSYQSQIKVKSDGNDVSVQAHPSYYGQLCGVCSNYNSEPSDDYMGPQQQQFRDPEQFLLSYIIPDSQCNIDEVRQQLDRRTPNLMSQRGECQKQEKNVKVERKVGKTRQTCFSVYPIGKCVGTCEQSQKKEKTPVTMKCLPSKDARTVELLRKLKNGQQLDELRHSCDQKPMPRDCIHQQLVVQDRCDSKQQSQNDARTTTTTPKY